MKNDHCTHYNLPRSLEADPKLSFEPFMCVMQRSIEGILRWYHYVLPKLHPRLLTAQAYALILLGRLT